MGDEHHFAELGIECFQEKLEDRQLLGRIIAVAYGTVKYNGTLLSGSQAKFDGMKLEELFSGKNGTAKAEANEAMDTFIRDYQGEIKAEANVIHNRRAEVAHLDMSRALMALEETSLGKLLGDAPKDLWASMHANLENRKKLKKVDDLLKK